MTPSLFLTLLVCGASPRAETLGAQFLARPLSTRQIGMGEVSFAGRDPFGAWSNPALLAGAGGAFELEAGGGSMFAGAQTTASLAARWGIGGGWALGAGAARVSLAEQAEVDDVGDPTGRSLGHQGLMAGAGVAGRWRDVTVGALLKGASEDLAGAASTAAALDAGILADLDGFVAGAAFRNFGPRNASGLTPPREFRAGAGTGTRLAALRLSSAVEYVGALGGQGWFGGGVEWWVRPQLGLRLGFRQSGEVSGGFTAALGELSLDYGFWSHPLGATHVAGLTFRAPPRAVRAATEPGVPSGPGEGVSGARMRGGPVVPRPGFLPLLRLPLPALAPARTWRIEVKDASSRVVRSLAGEGPPPPEFDWNGADEEGAPVPDAARARIVVSVTDIAGRLTTRTLPASVVSAEPRLQSGSVALREVNFVLPDAPYQCWRLEVREGEAPLSSWEGAGAPDPAIRWDGRHPDGTPVEAGDLRYAWEFYDDAGMRMAGEASVPQLAADVVPGTDRDRVTLPFPAGAGARGRFTPEQWAVLDKAARLVARNKENKLILTGGDPSSATAFQSILFNRYHSCGERIAVEPGAPGQPAGVAVDVHR